MQFIVIAYDGTDDGALDRRIAAREEHLKKVEEMYNNGNLLYAVVMKDDNGKMIGSTVICDFPSRQELDNWLKVEPYVTGKVWENIEVRSCQAPPFISNVKLS